MENSGIPLAENFNRFFNVDLAVTPEQKEQVFKIRYRVYCEELQLEPADRFPGRLEYDEYDDQSLHCLVTHKKTGFPAACVRLVSVTGSMADDPLPMERYCLNSLYISTLETLNKYRHNICEISRLAIDPLFRRRRGEDQNSFGKVGAFDICHQEKRAFSMVGVATFLSATVLTELAGRRKLFAMMDPLLPRLLGRSGINFHLCGAEMDYHGMRSAYSSTTESILKDMRPELHNLYYSIFSRFVAVYNNCDLREVV